MLIQIYWPWGYEHWLGHGLWLIPILAFICLPIYSYFSIRTTEHALRAYRSIIPLGLALCRRKFGKELKAQRMVLQQELRQLVEELGPEMGDSFWKDRVLQPLVDSKFADGPKTLELTPEEISACETGAIHHEVGSRLELETRNPIESKE